MEDFNKTYPFLFKEGIENQASHLETLSKDLNKEPLPLEVQTFLQGVVRRVDYKSLKYAETVDYTQLLQLPDGIKVEYF